MQTSATDVSVPCAPIRARYRRSSDVLSERRGATLTLVVILLPAMFAVAAFVINIAYIETTSTDVQIAADAAVRAAGREYALTESKTAALAVARETAARNPVAGQVLPINASDLEFGVSTRPNANEPYRFVPSGSGNAVRLTTRSLAEGNQISIPALFPIFGSKFDVRPLRTATSTQATIDLTLVIDRSGSMAFSANEVSSPHVPPVSAPVGWQFGDAVPANARWLDLIAAVRTFNDELRRSPQDERVALSTYNTESATNVLLTDDYPQIIDALNEISTNFTKGGTSIGRGMLEGAAATSDPSISREFASKVIVVMTDGNHNFGLNPRDAARRVASQGTTIFTVTFSNEANQNLMREVAQLGNGRHFHAGDAAQLRDAFKEIARRLPSLLTR